MERVLTTARSTLGLACAGFAAQYLHVLPPPGPPWYPVHHSLSLLAGLALLIVAIGLCLRGAAHLCAALLGSALIVRFLLLHLPDVALHLRDPNRWTGAGEVLAIAGGAWMLAAALPGTRTTLTRVLGSGRYLFAAPLLLFSFLHFRYAFFISQLIPAWIPQRFFWANFVGLCFLAAALAILTGVRRTLAAYMLAAMFLLWVAILHAPRVVAAPHDGNEWTSMLIALAMAGCSLAAVREPHRPATIQRVTNVTTAADSSGKSR